MPPTSLKILRLQVQCLQRGQIVLSQPSKIIQQLLQRLALTFFCLCPTIKRLEAATFAMGQDDPCTRHPIGALPVVQMPNNVKRVPGICAFVSVYPRAWQTSQEGIQHNGG